MRVSKWTWGFLAGRVATAAFAADSQIRLNTIGFLPDRPKCASSAAKCSSFSVVRASDGAKVLEGTATGPVINPDTAEKLWTADFSKLSEPGEFRLELMGVGRQTGLSAFTT